MEMLQQTQRESVNRQQRFILALGCGSSVFLHLGLIAGISYWWRSPAAVDEPMAITLVEPSEIEPVTVTPSSPLAQPPKSIARPPVQIDLPQPKPTVLKSVSKPIVVTPTPKSGVVVVKATSQQMRSTTTQPKPRSSAIKPKVKPNPHPIQTAKVHSQNVPNPFPIDPTPPAPNPVRGSAIDPPKSKPIQRQPQTTPRPTTNPPFNLPTPQPHKTTAPPTSSPSSIAANSAPTPVKPKPLVATPPKLPEDPISQATTSDLSSPMSPKSQTRSTTSTPAPAADNLPDRQPIPRPDRSAEGGLTDKGSQSSAPLAGSLQPPNSSTSGSGNGNTSSAKADATQKNGLSPGVGSSDRSNNSSSNTSQTGSSGTGSNSSGGNASDSNSGSGGGLQCVRNCEIPRLRDLQDRDSGKDRMRIRIVIDPNGLVLVATISKSSDNPQIDALVLEGIKQMQFKPSGKILKGIIKANIIL